MRLINAFILILFVLVGCNYCILQSLPQLSQLFRKNCRNGQNQILKFIKLMIFKKICQNNEKGYGIIDNHLLLVNRYLVTDAAKSIGANVVLLSVKYRNNSGSNTSSINHRCYSKKNMMFLQ